MVVHYFKENIEKGKRFQLKKQFHDNFEPKTTTIVPPGIHFSSDAC